SPTPCRAISRPARGAARPQPDPVARHLSRGAALLFPDRVALRRAVHGRGTRAGSCAAAERAAARRVPGPLRGGSGAHTGLWIDRCPAGHRAAPPVHGQPGRATGGPGPYVAPLVIIPSAAIEQGSLPVLDSGGPVASGLKSFARVQ